MLLFIWSTYCCLCIAQLTVVNKENKYGSPWLLQPAPYHSLFLSFESLTFCFSFLIEVPFLFPFSLCFIWMMPLWSNRSNTFHDDSPTISYPIFHQWLNHTPQCSPDSFAFYKYRMGELSHYITKYLKKTNLFFVLKVISLKQIIWQISSLIA